MTGSRFTVVVQNSTAAATTLTWQADRDCFLIAVTDQQGNVVVSDDPSMTVALWGTPTVTRAVDKFVVIYAAGIEWNAFIKSGTKVYFAFSSKDSCIALFEEAITSLSQLG